MYMDMYMDIFRLKIWPESKKKQTRISSNCYVVFTTQQESVETPVVQFPLTINSLITSVYSKCFKSQMMYNVKYNLNIGPNIDYEN
ncbi:hypothetical protein M0813_14335 [Anaeramoeba flamelloides]|uniref:Uncharacterized protein n=1 Tax=Anaeramoeba flamelloides TaxID=1746091 RepID=A0ABQ8Z5N9_9EUKA|nr:hypothetical protein M0813_14335 [Anaeramoeba flamelloides]